MKRISTIRGNCNCDPINNCKSNEFPVPAIPVKPVFKVPFKSRNNCGCVGCLTDPCGLCYAFTHKESSKFSFGFYVSFDLEDKKNSSKPLVKCSKTNGVIKRLKICDTQLENL